MNKEKKIKKTMEDKMKNIKNYGLTAFALFMAFAFMAPQAAYAAGTAAGITISNEATVLYDVGGTQQAELFSCAAGPCTEIASTDTTDFFVDRKVNFTVAWGEATSPKTVFTNSTAVMLYTIKKKVKTNNTRAARNNTR